MYQLFFLVNDVVFLIKIMKLKEQLDLFTENQESIFVEDKFDVTYSSGFRQIT